MKLPLPTYQHSTNLYLIAEAIAVFVNQIDDAIKNLIAEPNMQFHNKSHLVQLIMRTAGLFMCEESFKEVDAYLGSEGAEALLRDFGAHHG